MSSQSGCRTYTYSELEQLWTSNGGNPASAPIAAAIALAESGGNSCAYNASDPSGGSRGLWQINGVHGSLSTFDPNANAAAAVSVSSNGTNWKPWSTFTNGAYLQHLGGDAANATLLSSSSDSSGGTGSDGGSAAAKDNCVWKIKLPSPLHDVCLWYDGWSRAALGGIFIGLGAVVVIAGVVLLAGTTKPVQQIAVGAGKIPGIGTAVGAVARFGRNAA